MEATSLIRRGLFREALHSVQGHAAHTSARLREAQLLQLTGRNGDAHAHTQRLMGRLKSAIEVAQAWELMGAIAIDFGEIEKARQHLTKALKIAAGTSDLTLIARIRLRMIPTLSELGSQDLAAALGQARGSVTRCGDRHSLALLHLRFGQVEAKRGLLERAREHLDSGWRLLADEPNAWIDGLLSLDASSVSAMDGNAGEAIRFAEAALSKSRESGHLRTEVGALSNLCAFALREGKVDEANDLINQALTKAVEFQRLRMALLDNSVQLALLRNDLANAERIMSEVEAGVRTRGDSRNSWLSLSAYLTRIRLLSRLDDWDGALREATAGVELADDRGDRLMRVFLRLRGTEALLRLGRKTEAHDLLGAALASSEGASLTVLAELERVRGLYCVDHGDPIRAAEHLHRATRLVATVGDALIQSEVSSAINRANRDLGVQADAGARRLPSAPRLDPPTVEALSHLLGLAGKPEALGREAVDLIGRLDCALDARVASEPRAVAPVGEHDGNACPSVSDDTVEIDLGNDRHRSYRVVTTLRNSMSFNAPLLALKRVVETGVQLTCLARRDRAQTSLWPPEADLDANTPLLASASLREAVALARQAALSTAPVLLVGETGAGKEVIAREIHRCSPFAAGPFLPFNCTAIPHEMFDAQLFGHRRGAFTGAVESSPGVIRAAEGGSLFLDEIGDLAPNTQPKLLRFLDSGEVHPVGESRPILVTARVLAATNANLGQLIAEGRFRQDLYYRLGVFQIAIPPLRERREEIPSLCRHFVERYSREMKKPVLDISDEALEHLLLYSWPGNVRELSAEMQRCVVLSGTESVLTPEVLSERVRSTRRAPALRRELADDNLASVSLNQPLALATEDLERSAIARALVLCDGNLEHAASLLGISRKGLLLKRQRLGFTVPSRIPRN